MMMVHYTNWRFEKPNEIGDSSGLANGLFSALAFAGVIYAILLQRRELRLQRAELEQTREELKGQKKEFQTQNDTLRHQRFENTFFQMLSLLQSIIENLTYTYDDKTKLTRYPSDSPGPETEYTEIRKELKGREVFRFAFTEAPQYYGDNKYYKGMAGVMKAMGLEQYNKWHTTLYFDHYFRTLYRIVKFVKETPLLESEDQDQEKKDRYMYTSIMRAQLSRYELVWLYYNCILGDGREKFKPLVEEFSLLKNLRIDYLIDHKRVDNDYAETAFGNLST